jgi:hypothetical protein
MKQRLLALQLEEEKLKHFQVSPSLPPSFPPSTSL